MVTSLERTTGFLEVALNITWMKDLPENWVALSTEKDSRTASRVTHVIPILENKS